MLGVRPPATKTVIITMHCPVKKQRKTKDYRTGVSLKDIYQTLHKPRPESSESRKRCIEYAQLHTLYGDTDRQRPDIISLPSGSRPHSTYSSRSRSTVSRAVTLPDYPLQRADIMADSEFGAEEDESRCLTSLSTKSTKTSSSSTFCTRIKSAVDREMDGLASSLSRQCCEVLGPKSCHECDVVDRKEDGERLSVALTGVYTTSRHRRPQAQDNYTTAVLVSRMMPGVPEYVVQAKVSRGEVRKEGFRDKLARRMTGDPPEYYVNEMQLQQQQPTSKALVPKTSETFFTSIKDLNKKLIAGKSPPNFAIGRHRNDERKTFSETMCPAFVSPKKVSTQQAPSFTMNYEPPLLPKVRQNVEPAFFAGSSGAYKLPDRLPDQIFSEQENDEKTPTMSRMSTNYSISNTPTMY